MTSPNAPSLPLPRIACHVIVEQNDHILLLERIKPPFKGLLAVPGGKLEPGEFISECAKRELFEETGLRAESIALKKLLHERSEQSDWQWIIYVYHCTAFSGELIADGPEGKLAWYDTGDIESLNCSPVDKWLYQATLNQPANTIESHEIFFTDPMTYEICDSC